MLEEVHLRLASAVLHDWHWHRKVEALSLHSAPFWQGLDRQRDKACSGATPKKKIKMHIQMECNISACYKPLLKIKVIILLTI